MSLIEKWYSFLILFSVIIGIGIGNIDLIRGNAEFFIIPLLIIMLYISFLQIPKSSLTSAIKNINFTYTSLFINFVWTPIFAWLLALVFLGNHPALIIGFVMLMVTPCTDWYLVFTNIAKGNVAISAAILPFNLILQILLLPVYLVLFAGSKSMFDIHFLLKSVVFIVLLPLLVAYLTNFLLRNKGPIKDKLLRQVSSYPIILLCFAIVAMFASQGQLLLNNLGLLWKISVPLLLFFTINFLISQKVGRQLNFTYADRASLSLTTLARNSPIALAIALTAFPDQPIIALTLVIGPLLELPILAIVSQLLLKKHKGLLPK